MSVVQDQFLTVVSREEALARFATAFNAAPIGVETVPLAAALGRVVADAVTALCDAPPFDRAVVDGFAVRAEDIAATPVTLRLTGETIACGHAPAIMVTPGTASAIATGGPMPRGADAVVMIEHTDPDGAGIRVRRSVGPGQFVAFAGSDIARGETVIPAGRVVGAREIGMAAAVGIDRITVYRRPRVAVVSTGDELVAAGAALGPAQIYDSNGPVIAAAVADCGCEPVPFGAIPDEQRALATALGAAHARADVVIVSGGTSKGAGDLTYRQVQALGAPGIIVHGVALKPGKPLCLAIADGKPVIVLPGFPTSAMFTFHDMIAPMLRRMAGLPATTVAEATARLPVRVASELGRDEFVMVALASAADGLVAYPVGKGSGSVTAFGQADGFLKVPADRDHLPAGDRQRIQLFQQRLTLPDLVIMGSHCLGLDAVIAELARAGVTSRCLALGSLGGLGALKRGECDLAPIHLLDPATGRYNEGVLPPGARLIPGWRRQQGVVFRLDDARLTACADARAVFTRAVADPGLLMVNRNQGAGTRILTDQWLAGAKPAGYWNQPRSHTAVAAAVVQGRADWGVAIAPVATASGLGFLPMTDEHYDIAVAAEPTHVDAVAAFEAAVIRAADRLRGLGFRPA